MKKVQGRAGPAVRLMAMMTAVMALLASAAPSSFAEQSAVAGSATPSAQVVTPPAAQLKPVRAQSTPTSSQVAVSPTGTRTANPGVKPRSGGTATTASPVRNPLSGVRTSSVSSNAIAAPPPLVLLNQPQRLVDTRAAGGPITSGSSRCFQVVGLAGIPSDASAVVLNVTAVGQTTNGWVSVFPNGQPVPATSTLNFGTSEYAMANGSIMPPGNLGQVCVNVGTVNSVPGSAQVILDATGFLPSSALTQVAMLPAPVRLTDTRTSGGPIATGTSRCFTVAGLSGIPADAAALVLNVTAAGYATSGWLTAYPNGQPVPNTSTLNFDQSEYAIANNTIMRIGSGGQVCVNVGTVGAAPGSSQVILDATGYLTVAALVQLPMLGTPQRLLDTRVSGGPIVTGGSRCFPVGGQVGIPDTATGVVFNLTAVGYGTRGWLTAYPTGEATPATSTLNFDPSEYAMANGGIVRLGNSGQVCVNVGTINSLPGSAHIVVDVVGYLASTAAASDSFAGAATLVAPAVASGDTQGASLEPGESQNTCSPIDRSVWYRITAPSAGTLFVNTRQTNFPTLTLWSGSTLQNLTQVACGNPLVSASGAITTPIQAGQTYFLQIGRSGSFGGAPETFVLDVHLDTTGLPDLAPVVNQLQDIWVVERPLDVPVEMQNRGSMSAPASTLGIFADTPPSPGARPMLMVNVPSLGPGATTTVQGTLAAGSLGVGTHTVAVEADSTVSVTESDETNNVDQALFPIRFGHEAPNDVSGSPIHLAIPSTVTANNVFAIDSFFFDYPCGSGTIAIGQRLFYTVTPTSSGVLTLTITQTNFDTVVLTADLPQFSTRGCALTRVGQPPNPLSIPVTAGLTYQIAVASWISTSEGGTFTLDIH